MLQQYMYILDSLESTAQNFASCIFSGNNLYTIINEIKNMSIKDINEVKDMFKDIIITDFEIYPDE